MFHTYYYALLLQFVSCVHLAPAAVMCVGVGEELVVILLLASVQLTEGVRMVGLDSPALFQLVGITLCDFKSSYLIAK